MMAWKQTKVGSLSCCGKLLARPLKHQSEHLRAVACGGQVPPLCSSSGRPWPGVQGLARLYSRGVIFVGSFLLAKTFVLQSAQIALLRFFVRNFCAANCATVIFISRRRSRTRKWLGCFAAQLIAPRNVFTLDVNLALHFRQADSPTAPKHDFAVTDREFALIGAALIGEELPRLVKCFDTPFIDPLAHVVKFPTHKDFYRFVRFHALTLHNRLCDYNNFLQLFLTIENTNKIKGFPGYLPSGDTRLRL
jgi:hypothetical protein